MKAHPKADRKQKILEAAVKVFTDKGAAFAKLNEVAKLAKVPAPLIHYYYETLEDLHLDVIQFALLDLKEYSTRLLTPKLNPTQLMKEYIRGPFLWIDEKPGLASIWIYFYYLASWSERFKEMNTQIRLGGRDRIAMLIYQGIEQKIYHLPEGKAVLDVAYEIQAAITGHALLHATEKAAPKKNAHYDHAVETIFKILGVKA
jgi:AcrR family transcriptional regulator